MKVRTKTICADTPDALDTLIKRYLDDHGDRYLYHISYSSLVWGDGEWFQYSALLVLRG